MGTTNVHLNLTQVAINQSEETLIKGLIVENWDACLIGLEYVDVGIFYYYTNFKAYKGLHNYNVVEEMLRIAKNDRERTFAYCWKLHLAEDAVSHNYNVPAAIRSTKLPNYIIHPIQELKIEGLYLNPVANRMMEKHREFDSFVKQATGRDWSNDAERLNKIIGGGNFYSQAFAPDSTTWMGTAQKYMYKFVALFVSGKTSIDYYRLSVDEAMGVLRGETSQLDPSGEEALRDADSSTQLWLYIGTFAVIIIIFIVSWRKKWI